MQNNKDENRIDHGVKHQILAPYHGPDVHEESQQCEPFSSCTSTAQDGRNAPQQRRKFNRFRIGMSISNFARCDSELKGRSRRNGRDSGVFPSPDARNDEQPGTLVVVQREASKQKLSTMRK